MGRRAYLDDNLRSIADRPAAGWSLPLEGTVAPSRALVLAIVAWPFAILAAGLVAGLAGNGWYRWLIIEDGPVERLQFLALLAAALGAYQLARRAMDRARTRRALVCAGVALLLLFVAGEEISWGQRMLGWETPERLADLNRQRETNVHNIIAIERLFRVGMIGLLLCGGLIPLLTGRGVMAGIPRGMLAPYVLLPLLGQVVGLLYTPPERYRYAVAESAELMELVVYSGILLVVLLHLRAVRR